MRYYMHTIDGRPAVYQPGEQIGLVFVKVTRLAVSLRQIRKEQAASHLFREGKRYYDMSGSYGHVIIHTPES